MLACYYTYTCRCFFLHIDFFVPLSFLEMPRKNATKCNGKDLKQRFTFVIHFPIRTCRFPCLVLRQKYSIIIILSLLSFHFFFWNWFCFCPVVTLKLLRTLHCFSSCSLLSHNSHSQPYKHFTIKKCQRTPYFSKASCYFLRGSVDRSYV